ncbi:TPR end-of-group domain-containing protein [Nostoc sp.]|uniref:TPR end-of-group domain-containing protein n=1 Tax=Nostoc sp. TaxID=1180 RepID=UPI002FFABFF5
MLNNDDLLANLYNAFNPFDPLPAGDPKYVDCQDVRGDADIEQELGNRMRLADTNTCQLYSGHRGAGKSTELLKLKKYLENRQFSVVYFAADEEDIDSEDAQYTDILLACTRRLLKDLKEIASPDSILNWLKSRWEDLKDLAQTPIEFESLEVEAQLAQFAKLTANLRAVPELRQKIPQRIDPYTVTLIEVLNEFLLDAKKNLPTGKTQLAVIVDNYRGIALGKLGRNEEAIASYDQALKFKPDLHEAWCNRGNALGKLGRNEEAIASYDQALKFKPDLHEAWNNRAIPLGNLGRNEEAIASYDQALKFKPDYHQAWYNKACYYALKGNIEQALENLQQAINLNPDEYREMAKTDSDFDGIREDERFQALIQ